MTDPERNDPLATEFERRLLDAGRAERVPPQFKLRMQQALQSGSALPASAFASKASILSLLSVAVLAGVLGLRALHETARPAARAAQTSAAPLPAQSVTLAAAQRQPLASEQAPAPSAKPRSPERGKRALGNASAQHESLRDEIGMLDGAHSALQAGQSAQALETLARYAQRFPRGALSPEADALRVEALMQRGEQAHARELARRFLAMYPSSPLGDRVRRAAAE